MVLCIRIKSSCIQKINMSGRRMGSPLLLDKLRYSFGYATFLPPSLGWYLALPPKSSGQLTWYLQLFCILTTTL